MSLTAVSPLCISYDKLCDLLAASKWWQRLVVLPTATVEQLQAIEDADTRLSSERGKAAIWPEVFHQIDEDHSEVIVPHPFVLARYAVDGNLERTSFSGFQRQDGFEISIEFEIPEVYRKSTGENARLSYYDALNKLGKIEADWRASTVTAGSLQVDSFTRGALGRIAPADSNGQWLFSASYSIKYQGAC
jgi:hypothetical protein